MCALPPFGLRRRPSLFLLRGLPPRLPGPEESPCVLRRGGALPRLPPFGDWLRGFRVPPGERGPEPERFGLWLFRGLLLSRLPLRRVPPGDLGGLRRPWLSRLAERGPPRLPRPPAGDRVPERERTAGAPVPLFLERWGNAQFLPLVHLPFLNKVHGFWWSNWHPGLLHSPVLA